MGALLVIEVLSTVPGLFNPETSISLRKVIGLLVILGSTVLCIARPVRSSTERVAWACIAGFLVCNSLGAAYFAAKLITLEVRPAPSLSDLFWFLRYPFLYAGVHLLIRARTPGFRAGQWVDGAVGAFSLVAVSGIFVIEAVLDNVSDPVARGIFVAYPVANVLGLGFLIGPLALMCLRLRSWAALGGALFVFTVADGMYTRAFAINGSPPMNGLYDAGYLSCAFLLAIAAWQQPPREREDLVPRSISAVLPLAFGALGLVLLLLDDVRTLNPFVAGGAALALAAVLVRQALFARENRRILVRVREEAITDALTGLPNRRCLIEDLDRRVEDATEQTSFIVALMDLDGFKGYNDAFGHHAGDDLLARLGRKLQVAVAEGGRAYRLGGDEFCVVTEAGRDGGEIAARAAAALKEEGRGFQISCSYGTVLVPSEADEPGEVLGLADGRMYADKGEGRRLRHREEASAVLSAVLRERYPGLDGHNAGVANLAVRVAERLGVEHRIRDEVRLGAMLHDVGKMAVPEAILEKPGPLDAREMEFMRRHTVVGARIIESAKGLAHVAYVAKYHHERWDGGGYPTGLAGDNIPLAARIISICDAFQAMIVDRPYRRGRPVAEALEEIRRCAGSQFDPYIVHAFVDALADSDIDAEIRSVRRDVLVTAGIEAQAVA